MDLNFSKNDKKKDHLYEMVVLFWPIWVPVISFIVYLFYLSA